MKYRLLHLSIAPAYQTIDRQTIEARLTDLGRDWMGYNALSWMLWTNKSIITVSEMISGHLEPADHLLVVSVNTAEIPSGRLAEWMWEWINRPRDPLTGDVLTPKLPAPAAKSLFDPENPWLLAAQGEFKPD